MTATTYERGHLLFLDEQIQKWRYVDNREIAKDQRPCIRCGELPTPEGHDACLGDIPETTSACCGHGIKEEEDHWNRIRAEEAKMAQQPEPSEKELPK